MDDDLALEVATNLHRPTPSRPTGIPRSKRQPFHPTGNTESTPRPTVNGSATPGTIEPLSIKKKTSVRAAPPTVMGGSPTPAKKSRSRTSPLSRTIGRVASPRRFSPSQVRNSKAITASSIHNASQNDLERVVQLSKTTKEDARFLVSSMCFDSDWTSGRILSPRSQTIEARGRKYAFSTCSGI